MGGPARNTAIVVPLWVLAAIATVFLLRAAAPLLIPIVLAVLISYVLEPVVAGLVRYRIPRPLGSGALLLAVLMLAGSSVYALRHEVRDAVTSLPHIVRQTRELAGAYLQGGAGQATGRNVGEFNDSASRQDHAVQSGSRPDGGIGPGALIDGLTQFVQQGVESLFALAGHLTVIFFLVFFLLTYAQHVGVRIIEVAGPDDDRRRAMRSIVEDVNAKIQRFLTVRLITAAVVGAATWGILAAIGAPNAVVWGILAGIFNSIPYFGPLIVSGGLLVVGLVQGGGLTQALEMAGAALVITALEGWLLTPILMGKAERMSALAVFFGLLVWTWIWGVWGTILAVPMLVMVKSIVDHVPSLKIVGRLMAP
jgi:predicted PurR-regulated permease PerM